MKVGRILMLLVLFFVLIGSDCLVYGQDRDDFGKLSMWIVDPVSENQVNEEFVIELFSCEKVNKRYLRQAKTDKYGYLSLKVRTGTYCLHIYPKSKDSKYCIEPYHFKSDQFFFPIMIEKGKITEIRKKATFGGSLKIKLLDTNGKLIIPSEEFPEGAEVHVSIDSPNYIIGQFSKHIVYDNMDDGETIVRTLFPSKYNLRVSFVGTGFKTLNFENIQIKVNEQTEIDCLVDINDITGIEGSVFDINGNPMKGINVTMIPKFSIDGDFSNMTDINGYYRITGLPEGSYLIMTSSLISGTRIHKDEIIEIKKGVLIRKDIITN